MSRYMATPPARTRRDEESSAGSACAVRRVYGKVQVGNSQARQVVRVRGSVKEVVRVVCGACKRKSIPRSSPACVCACGEWR